MTLVIGVQCTDGVVLGAESEATLDTEEADVRESVEKIVVLNGDSIFGVAGASSAAYHYENEVAKQLRDFGARDGQERFSCSDLAKHLQQHMVQLLTDLNVLKFKDTGVPLSEVCAKGLLGTLTSDGPRLLSIEGHGTVDAHLKIQCRTIGAGETEAAPFLRYLRRHVWQGRTPDIGTGILSTLWALRYACQVSPERFTPPFLIATLARDGNDDYVARILSEQELSGHYALLKDVETSIGNLSLMLQQTDSQLEPPIPPIPQPQ